MFSQPVVRRLLPPVVIRRGPPVMNPQRPQAVARRLPPAGNRPAPAVVTHWSQELLRNVHNIQVRVIRNIHRIQGPVIRRRPLVQRNQQQLAQAAVNAVVQIAGNQNARNQNARRRRQPRELDSSDDEDEQQNAGIEVAPPPIDPKCHAMSRYRTVIPWPCFAVTFTANSASSVRCDANASARFVARSRHPDNLSSKSSLGGKPTAKLDIEEKFQ